MRDVAKASGVSLASVSRILGSDSDFRVRPETRQKVLDAARQLGYIHSKKFKEGGKIGCVLNYTAARYSDKYFTTILSSAEKELQGSGYSLGPLFTMGELASDLDKLKQERLSGLLLLDDTLQRDALDGLKESVPCLVGVDTDYAGIDNIGHDNYRTGMQAMEHLANMGNHKIAYIGGDDRSFLGRECAYVDWMNLRNIQIGDNYIMDCGWEPDVCYQMVIDLCKSDNRPSAIFAGSDNLAIAVLSAVQSLGLKVPDDIAVIGVNNLDFSAFTSPPLTTVSIPMEEIGRMAVELLLRRIRGFDGLPIKILFPVSLIVRKST